MAGHRLERAARRWADQQSDRVASLPVSRRLLGTVTATSPVTVSWRGASIVAAAVNVATTVAVGDRVVCDLIDSQLIVDYITT